jgi:hypothetical protein
MATDHGWGDAVYEVWRRGGNPDAVSRDSMAHDRARGYDEAECVRHEVDRVLGVPERLEDDGD